MMLWLCVLVRIVANPLSNVFQKVLTRKTASPLFVICATHGLLCLACLPIVWWFPPPLAGQFWWNMGIGALLTVSGNGLLVAAVQRADLSVLGPINSYKAVVSLVPGMILLHEFPGAAGLTGILLIVAGSYLVMDQGDEPGGNVFVRFWRDRGVQFRLAALVLSATEAVFMKKALLASSPLPTFAVWSMLGFVVSLVAVAALSERSQIRHELAVLQANRSTYGLLFVTTGLMQLCTIITFTSLQVGYALALFQTSTLLSVLLGYTVFQERHFLKRLAGAFVMAAGAVLIVIAR